MAVDGVDVVTKTKLCFCGLVAPLLQLLLSIDLVDIILSPKESGVVSLLRITDG